jgi:hypothetical protein
MSNAFKILDQSIGLTYREAKKINGVPGISFYFTRKTVDSNIPIEIAFVDYDGQLHAVSKQLQNSLLEKVEVSGVDKFFYKNDIVFDASEIQSELDSIENEERPNNVTSVVDELFGIDISSVDGINGFEFDKMVYIDRMDGDGSHNYLDGYMLLFHDISTKIMKMAIYAGELVPFTYQDYLDEINAYGRNRILSEVIVENSTDLTVVRNTSKYRVKMRMNKYRYDINRAVYDDKNFVKKEVDEFEFVLDPGQEFEFVHQRSQRDRVYSMLDNPIAAPDGPIMANSNAEYLAASEYILEEPFELSFVEVLSPVGVTDPDKYIAVSSFHQLFESRGVFENAIVDKDDDLSGLTISNSHGSVTISDDTKFKQFVSSGSVSTFASKIKVMTKAKLKRIYSHLGQDELNMLIDFGTASTRYRVLNLQNRIVYNDTISMPQQAFTVTIGLIGNINEVLQLSSHVEYVDRISKEDLPCKTDREAVISKIIGSELFTSSYLKFNANEVINHPSKKLFQGPPYRTYNGELDDAYEMYQEALVSEISGFNLVNTNNILSSAEFASIMPAFNMRPDVSDPCREDFVFSIEESIDEHGLEISLNQMLAKMKKVAYVYRQPEEIIATVVLGITLDAEWYFCGEDFFPAEAINNAEFSTYVDNDIVTLSREMTDGFRPIYDKKLFLDSNDWDDDYKQYMHDAYMAFVVGATKTSTINDNPGMKYIVDHLFDSQRKLSFSYDELFMQSRDIVFSKRVETVKNTMLMPNIFEQLIADEKTGFSGYVGDDNIHHFGKLRKEYSVNYSDLQIDDAYDSAYEIGHDVDAMMNISAMNTGAALYSEYGKLLFGVNTGKFAVTDSLSVTKLINTIIDGEIFAFGLGIVKNGIVDFVIAYDYKTKKLVIDNRGKFEIMSFPLLLASFDIILHDYYHSLEGYKRVALGVYDYYESSLGEDVMSKQYLLMNNTIKEEEEYILLSAVVGVFDAQVEIQKGDTAIKSEILGYNGANEPYMVNVGLNDKFLTIDKDGSDTMRYSMQTLQNYPDSKIISDGSYIQLYRVKRFLPTRYMDSHLTRATLTILSVNSTVSNLSSMEGDIKVVDFGESRAFLSPFGDQYVFALGGEGLSFWRKHKSYISAPDIVYDIDAIMDDIGIDEVFAIDGIIFQVTFE